MYFKIKSDFVYINPEEIFFIVRLENEYDHTRLVSHDSNNMDSFQKVKVYKRNFEMINAQINDYTSNNHPKLFIDEQIWNKIKTLGDSIFQ